MWRSYGGHKGVAVSCDGPALLKQFKDTIWVRRNFLITDDRGLENFELLYGYVDYERPPFDVEVDDSGPTVTVGHSAFHKHHFFRLDQEYRFAAKLTTDETAYYSAGATLDLAACNTSVSTSPLCPFWIAKSVEAVTRQFYPNIAFERLKLE
jgi:hypothetical protein